MLRLKHLPLLAAGLLSVALLIRSAADLAPMVLGEARGLSLSDATFSASALPMLDTVEGDSLIRLGEIYITISFIGIILLLACFGIFLYYEIVRKHSSNPVEVPGRMASPLFRLRSRRQINFSRSKVNLLLELEQGILERIAMGRPLAEVLREIALNYEANCRDAICSILLLDQDGRHMRHAAGPSLPREYIEAIDGAEIGPIAGSCGTAAYRKQRVVVTDIEHDLLWTDYKELALSQQFRACWSTPIIGNNGLVLGTFAIYYKKRRAPNELDLKCIDRATYQAKIAIEFMQSQIRVTEGEEKYRVLVEQASDGIFIHGCSFQFLEANESAIKMLGYAREELTKLNIEDVVVVEAGEPPLRLDELKDGQSVLQERKLKRNDGTLVPVEISAAKIGNGNYLAIVRDITSRKRDQLKLEKQYKMIEEYAFINAHEVRARVATMLGLMNLYIGNNVEGVDRDWAIHQLYRETNNLDEIIKKLSVLINHKET